MTIRPEIFGNLDAKYLDFLNKILQFEAKCAKNPRLRRAIAQTLIYSVLGMDWVIIKKYDVGLGAGPPQILGRAPRVGPPTYLFSRASGFTI